MSLILLGILNSQAAAAGGAGAYDLLETQTLASSASSVTFTGLGSYSDYKHLQIRMVTRASDAAGIKEYRLRLNGDSGTNYSSHVLYGNGSVVSSESSTSSDTIRKQFTTAATNDTNAFGAAVLDVLDFSSSSKNTTLRSLFGSPGGTFNTVGLSSGLWINTSAVTSIQVFLSSNSFIAGSRFSLYGIKGA